MSPLEKNLQELDLILQKADDGMAEIRAELEDLDHLLEGSECNTYGSKVLKYHDEDIKHTHLRQINGLRLEIAPKMASLRFDTTKVHYNDLVALNTARGFNSEQAREKATAQVRALIEGYLPLASKWRKLQNRWTALERAHTPLNEFRSVDEIEKAWKDTYDETRVNIDEVRRLAKFFPRFSDGPAAEYCHELMDGFGSDATENFHHLSGLLSGVTEETLSELPAESGTSQKLTPELARQKKLNMDTELVALEAEVNELSEFLGQSRGSSLTAKSPTGIL